MQIITLMRHAKSSWAQANQADYERPLNKRGHRDAPEMAGRLVERNTIPTIILSSSAQRTRDTTAHLLDVFGKWAPQVHYLDAMYLASPGALLNSLHDVADNEHIMLVAHNPGIEDLSAQLQGIDDDTMPTAAVRQFECATSDTLRTLLQNKVLEAGLVTDLAMKLIYSDYPKSRSE